MLVKEEKMQKVDRELRRLQAESVRMGYSSAQVETFARPFVQASVSVDREKCAKRCVAVAVVVCMVYLLLQFQFPHRLAASVSRTALIKVLGVWDWTQVYHSQCLLANPLYTQPDTLILDDCQICEAIHSVRHVSNVESNDVVEKLFRRDIPIIVDDGLFDWYDVSMPQTPTKLAEFFDDNEVLRSERGCRFSSNVRSQRGGHQSFLHSLVQENILQYYAHWENCQVRAAKVLRAVYRRPYFLPPAVETSPTNWVFISRNYTGSLFKRVAIDQPLVMLLQVRGQVDIKVEAWPPCEELCPVLHDTLHAGQVLVVTDFLWKVSYRPSSSLESMAIGIGGSF